MKDLGILEPVRSSGNVSCFGGLLEREEEKNEKIYIKCVF